MGEQSELIEIIVHSLPSYAQIRVVPGTGTTHICVAWKVNDIPSRPNKTSKPIDIQVTSEAADEFDRRVFYARKQTTDKIYSYIQKRLLNFNQANDAPYGSVCPAEIWHVNKELIEKLTT